MKNELERLIEDRDEAESDMERFEDEMSRIEFAYPDTYEDREDWNAAHHEYYEANNWASYLTSCIADCEEYGPVAQ